MKSILSFKLIIKTEINRLVVLGKVALNWSKQVTVRDVYNVTKYIFLNNKCCSFELSILYSFLVYTNQSIIIFSCHKCQE